MLPSQTTRPVSRHSYMYRRKRPHRGPMIVVTVIILVALVGGWLWILEQGDSGRDGVIVPESSPETPATSSGDPQREALDRLPPARQPATAADTGEGSRQPAGPASRTVMPAGPSPATLTAGDTGRHVDGSNSPSRAASPKSQPARESIAEPSAPAQLPLSQSPPGAAAPAARLAAPGSPAPQGPGRAGAPAKPAGGEPTDARRRAALRLEQGLQAASANQPIDARRLLTAALDSRALAAPDEERARHALTDLSRRLVFGPDVVPNDPFAAACTVQSGDTLQAIASRSGSVDWRFVQRINNISRPERINAGQRLKVVTGVFHALVQKSAYRMDIYLGDSSGQDRVYVCSFPVGLGEFNATPEGTFRVKPASKLIDPRWVNPRTGEAFEGGDPRNPIGEHWIGLVGESDNILDLGGYGIHGTIEPDSIGTQKSMGCVRMLPDDVALVWELLAEGRSTVEIVK